MNWLWWRKPETNNPVGDYNEIAKRQTRLRYLKQLAEESDRLVAIRFEIAMGQWGGSPELIDIKVKLQEELRTVEGVLLDGLDEIRKNRRELIALCDRLPELREKLENS